MELRNTNRQTIEARLSKLAWIHTSDVLVDRSSLSWSEIWLPLLQFSFLLKLAYKTHKPNELWWPTIEDTAINCSIYGRQDLIMQQVQMEDQAGQLQLQTCNLHAGSCDSNQCTPVSSKAKIILCLRTPSGQKVFFWYMHEICRRCSEQIKICVSDV